MSETAVLPPKVQTETPESWFHQRATAYVEAQVLFHLNQTGVFGLLRKGGAHTAPQIAESLGLDPAATDALLDYVFEIDDLLERDAQQKYSLSDFGRKVIDRYSDGKAAIGQQSINMFDVRVGAYGPVWQNLGRMLTRDGVYGRDFHREGRYAENGVFKLAMQFWNSLVEHVDELNVASVLEVGLTTGLLDKLAERYPATTLYGLDRNPEAIERTAANLAAKDTKNFHLIQGDYFAPEEWTKQVDGSRRGMIFSLHFHELIAGGEQTFVDVLRSLRRALPGWVLVAFEQPRLPHDDRGTIPETLWLYSQSNILIHHLIGNGRILSREAWIDLGRQAGCRQVTDRPCNYLGYRAFVYEL